MVARQPAERALWPHRVIATHFHATLAQRVPEPSRRPSEATHPVVDEPHGNAFAGLADQGVGEFPTAVVLVDEVHLEVDVPSRRPDRLQPSRIVLARILEQADPIAVNERGAGGARERLGGERAQLWQPRALVPFLVVPFQHVTTSGCRFYRKVARMSTLERTPACRASKSRLVFRRSAFRPARRSSISAVLLSSAHPRPARSVR